MESVMDSILSCSEGNDAEVEVDITMLDKSDKKSMEIDEENQGKRLKYMYGNFSE